MITLREIQHNSEFSISVVNYVYVCTFVCLFV